MVAGQTGNDNMTERKLLLKVENIAYSYASVSKDRKNERNIFSDVSFELFKGEILSILGPNGTGKSTLLNCIAGLLKINGGKIMYGDTSIEELTYKERSRFLGYVSQNVHIEYDYSVRDYIVMGRAPHLRMLEKPGKEDYYLVDRAIEELGIEKLRNKSSRMLSGGEKQMISIAKVMVQEPEIIIFDEPTSALDYGTQLKIMKLIRSLSEKGFTVIMTTHDPNQVILLDSKVGIMNREGYFEIGEKYSDIMKEEVLSDLYRTDIKMVYVEELGRTICASKKINL